MGDTQGARLPYFHRIQSQEDKDLIGDITPKIIKNEIKISGNRGALPSAPWNAADTWEERDCSHWSSQKITELFDSDFEITCDGCVAKISSLDKLKGSSQVTHIRGKARFFYDYSFELSFQILSITAEVFVGTLLLEDIVNDQLNDMEITVCWTQSAPKNEAYSQLKRVLTGKTLKSEIIKKMKMFENSLNKQI